MPKDIINIIHFPCKSYGSFFKEALAAGHVQFFFRHHEWLLYHQDIILDMQTNTLY